MFLPWLVECFCTSRNTLKSRQSSFTLSSYLPPSFSIATYSSLTFHMHKYPHNKGAYTAKNVHFNKYINFTFRLFSFLGVFLCREPTNLRNKPKSNLVVFVIDYPCTWRQYSRLLLMDKLFNTTVY